MSTQPARDPSPSLRFRQEPEPEHFYIPALREKGPSMTNPNPTREDEPIEFIMGVLLSDIRSQVDSEGMPLTPEEQDKYIAEIRTQVEAAMAQAREDAFNLVREALKGNTQDDRWTFIQYCLNGWIESGATGFLIVEYDAGLDDSDLRHLPGLPLGAERREAKVTAINQGDEEYDTPAVEMIMGSGKVCRNCGTPLTQRDGTWVDRTNAYACPSSDAEHLAEQAAFEITHETIELGLQRIRQAVDVPDTGTSNWERNLTSVPHLGQGLRNAIIEADLTNEASNLDAWGYTAIVEIALLGESVYA